MHLWHHEIPETRGILKLLVKCNARPMGLVKLLRLLLVARITVCNVMKPLFVGQQILSLPCLYILQLLSYVGYILALIT